ADHRALAGVDDVPADEDDRDAGEDQAQAQTRALEKKTTGPGDGVVRGTAVLGHQPRFGTRHGKRSGGVPSQLDRSEVNCPTPSPSQRVRGDQVAEIRPLVAGLRPLEHVVVHCPERLAGLYPEAVAEGADDATLEV